MKRHPLHSTDFIINTLRMTGEYPGERCTGRTTALAFEYIAKAIRNPGKELIPQDHHPGTPANRELCYKIRLIVEKLELQGFKFKMDTIQFG